MNRRVAFAAKVRAPARLSIAFSGPAQAGRDADRAEFAALLEKIAAQL
jgi:hypothetical protein